MVLIKYTQEKILGIYSLLSPGSVKFWFVVILCMLSFQLRNCVMKAYLVYVKFCQIKHIVHPTLRRKWSGSCSLVTVGIVWIPKRGECLLILCLFILKNSNTIIHLLPCNLALLSTLSACYRLFGSEERTNGSMGVWILNGKRSKNKVNAGTWLSGGNQAQPELWPCRGSLKSLFCFCSPQAARPSVNVT